MPVLLPVPLVLMGLFSILSKDILQSYKHYYFIKIQLRKLTDIFSANHWRQLSRR
jgi:hypothetical protein